MKTRRKLKYNPVFPICTENEDDEIYLNGIFRFNISRLIDYIQKNKDEITVEEIEIVDYIVFSTVNEVHIDSVDITKPVIIAEIAPNNFSLIDGNHRGVKASRLNHQFVKAYKIPMEININFLTNHSAYKSYVKYWNDKLAESNKI